MSKTFFAYHLAHYFGAFDRSNYYTNKENVHEGDTVYVVSGDSAIEGQGKDYWLEGVFTVHRLLPGNWVLPTLSGDKRSYKYRLLMEPVRVPKERIALVDQLWYSRTEMHRFFSSSQNFNPLPTRPNYKERFDLCLAESGQPEAFELAEDLLALQHMGVSDTERDVLAKARIGQGKFRRLVTEAWGLGESCALTGIAIPELLIASHIKPWRESNNEERLDPANGLLLATHIDKLFDQFLVSFQPMRQALQLAVHPRIRKVLSSLGVKAGSSLRTGYIPPAIHRRLEENLAGHYAKFSDGVLQFKG